MPTGIDTWEKPRATSTHLTAAEIEFIRQSYIDRLRIVYVAETLKCASRTVTKYYGFFREEGVERKRK